MIEEVLDKYFINNTRQQIEHRDTIYTTSVCCNKVVNARNNFTIPVGQCLRAAYYSGIGLGEISIGKERSIARKLGDYTEYMLLKMFEDAGVLVEKQIKFRIDKYSISGKVDAIIKDFECEAIVEIKSISSNQWGINSIFGSKWNSPAPKDEHILQCMVYLYAMESRINHAYILYIRRDNGDVKEFKIELAAENGIIYPVIDGKINRTLSCNSIFSNAEALICYLEKDIVPKRTYKIKYTKDDIASLYRNNAITKTRYEKLKAGIDGDFQCSSCGYKDICLKDGE